MSCQRLHFLCNVFDTISRQNVGEIKSRMLYIQSAYSDAFFLFVYCILLRKCLRNYVCAVFDVGLVCKTVLWYTVFMSAD